MTYIKSHTRQSKNNSLQNKRKGHFPMTHNLLIRPSAYISANSLCLTSNNPRKFFWPKNTTKYNTIQIHLAPHPHITNIQQHVLSNHSIKTGPTQQPEKSKWPGATHTHTHTITSLNDNTLLSIPNPYWHANVRWKYQCCH